MRPNAVWQFWGILHDGETGCHTWFPSGKDLHVNHGCAIQWLVSLAFLICETAITHFTGCGGLDVLTYGKPGTALGTQLVPNKR